jgi:hypothetical protein
MPTIGDTSKPSGGWHSFSGSSQNQQEAELLTAPERLDVVELAGWIGGWSASCRVKLCIWDDAGELLGQTAQITVANEGAGGPAGGNVALYSAALLTPVRIAAGVAFFVGMDRHADDAHQVSVGGAGSPDHYEGRHGGPAAPWAGDLGAATGGPSNQPRRCGMYVADYVAVAGAKVYRSGAWVDADSVQIMRSGVWVDADSVQVMRSGVWTDAE